MGLDQWLIKVKAVSNEYKGKLNGVLSYDEYVKLNNETSLSFYDVNDVDEVFPKEIKDIMIPVKVTERYMDLGKAFEDKFGEDVNAFRRSSACFREGESEHWFYNNKTDEKYSLIIKDNEEEKYEYDEVEDKLVIENINPEIAYWRKAYHLQYYMRNTQGYHGDCFYLPLTKEMIEETIDDLKKFRANPNDDEMMELFDVTEDDLKDDYIFSELNKTIREFESLLDTDLDDGFTCYYEWY